jgi:hypothetical protein
MRNIILMSMIATAILVIAIANVNSNYTVNNDNIKFTQSESKEEAKNAA